MITPAEQARQARLDLEELEAQIGAGEIDEETGRLLRATYLAELEAATYAAEIPTTTPPRPRGRLAVGAAILVVGLAVAIGLVGTNIEDRDGGALQGIAATTDFDPAAYSDETLEAVIAVSADDPAVADQLPYMRFALAERYFGRNEFRRAFAHYEAILSGEPPADLFAGTMTRIAWITFAGNGKVDLALDVVERAIEAAPASVEALYVKGQILWCGADDARAAVPLFQRVLSSGDLDVATRSQVESDLAAAADGQPCR